MMDDGTRQTPYGPQRWVVVASVIGISLAWGSTFLAYQLSLESFGPFALLSVRFLVGGALLYGWGSIQTRTFVKPKMAQWRSAAVAAVLLFAVATGALVWSQQYLSSALGGLLVGTIPVWTAVFAVLVFKERVDSSSVAALAVGLGGTALLLFGDGATAFNRSLLAVSVALLGVASWSFGSLVIRNRPSHPRPMIAAGMQMMCGGIYLTVVAIVTGEFGHMLQTRPTALAWVGLFYLTVPNSLTFGTFVWLLNVASPVLVSSYAYLSPVVAVVLGWWVLDETVTPLMLLGGAFVIVSVAILIRPSGVNRQQGALAPAPVWKGKPSEGKDSNGAN